MKLVEIVVFVDFVKVKLRLEKCEKWNCWSCWSCGFVLIGNWILNKCGNIEKICCIELFGDVSA